jgi:riboflavin synthase
MTFAAPASVLRYVVEKGSITVDGISLTVAALDDAVRGQEGATFDVAVIPHTLAVTTLGPKQPGDPVNLEADVLAKYVERLLTEHP